MPGLTGIEYVDTSNNQRWFELVRNFVIKPKLQCFGLGIGIGKFLCTYISLYEILS